MGPFLIAWLTGMTLSITHKQYLYKRVSPSELANSPTKLSPFPPKPGQLLVASGIYVGLAILAESSSLRTTATMAAWGYNIAIALQFAQDVAQDHQKGSVTGTVRNSGFWTPPTASSAVLFPNGTGGSPNAKPTAATSTLSTGSGTQVA